MSDWITSELPRTILVGAGVVGRAIVQAHLEAGVAVCVADQDQVGLHNLVDHLDFPVDQRSGKCWNVEPADPFGGQIPMVQIRPAGELEGEPDHWIVIESISERLDVKQAFFCQVEDWLDERALLCTNTSTIRIGQLASALRHPDRFCGMHFFMPVSKRPAVEIARGQQTSGIALARCVHHVKRLGKEPLPVRDGPGFIVNRMLSPYLNEAMLLLCRGIAADRIEAAALRYGMPMSPLELIDWIGIRTMFDAGRVYWQAFPDRIEPAAMLAALVKSGRFGRFCGMGFYDYVDGQRSERIPDPVISMVDRYRRDETVMNDDEVTDLLAMPMWIEAALAHREGVFGSSEDLDLAMRGGLGFNPNQSWRAYFDQRGSQAILRAVERWSDLTPAMRIPEELRQCLQQNTPTRAMEAFAIEHP